MDMDRFYRFIFLMLGFTLAVSGGITVIAFLNLLAAGYKFAEYLLYISRQPESYLLPIGLIIITASIYFSSNNEEN